MSARPGRSKQTPRRDLPARAADWGGPLATVVLSTLAAGLALRVWQWRPGTPLDLSGDSTYAAMEIRDILEHGWYWSNPDVGYPVGQAGWLFPDPSLISTLAVRFLGLFSTDPYTVGAVWFFVGFPLAGLALYVLARSQGIGRQAAVVVGTLFAVAPGHQTMADHLWLSAYWVLPIGLWLVLESARGRSPFRRRPGLALICLVVLGSGHIYYVAFTLLLLAVVLAVRTLAERRLRGVAAPALAGAIVALVALAPLLIARWAARDLLVTGELPATRTPSQSETYAGKLMDLILPWPGHRVPGLAYLRWAYDLNAHRTVEAPALGFIALVGLIGLAVLAARTLLLSEPRGQLALTRLAGLCGVALLFYTVGGLSSFVALFFSPQLRTWSRMWLVVFVFAILAVGYAVTHVGRRYGRIVGTLVAGLVLVVGVLDQTNERVAPAYDALRAERAALQAYTADLLAAAGPQCPIFQLPVTSFPEGTPRGEMAGYDQQLAYAAAQRPGLAWSGGGMHGTRAGDWQQVIDPSDPGAAADLAAAGFCAVEFDTEGYPEHSSGLPPLAAALGASIAATADGRFVAYRLPAAESEAPTRRAAVLAPVLVSLSAYPITMNGTEPVQWLAPRFAVTVANLGETTVRGVTVSFEVRSDAGQSRTLAISGPSGSTRIVNLEGRDGVRVEVRIDAAPGLTTVPVTVSGDPDLDSEPGQARSAEARGLSATAPDPAVRVVTSFEVARR